MSVIRVGAVKIAGSQESHNGSGDEAALPYTDADVLDIPLPEHTYQRPLPPSTSISHNNIGYFGLPYQDHNYGMPPPPSPPRPVSPRPPSPLQVNGVVQMEEEVKTTPLVSVVEEVVEDSITRCICGYLHDDGYMICCDKCSVWQHIDCMGVDRNNIPESYFCEQCQPRILDAAQAKILQKRKREELAARNVLSDSSATDTDPEEATNALASMGKKLPTGKKRTLKQKRAAKMKEKSQLKLKVGKSVMQKKLKKTGKKEKENIKTTKPRKIFKGATQKVKSGKTQTGKTPLLCLDQAQRDPWNCTFSPWTDEYEYALENHYSLAVRDYSSSSQHLIQNVNLSSDIMDQLQDQQTCVTDVKKNRKGLTTTQDIPAGQAIIEYKGKVFLTEEYDKQHSLVDRFKTLQPFTLFYSKLDVELCVDARTYGNEARFVRRSCFPNAEVQHTISMGEILFIIVAKEDIPSQAEITIPFDYDYKNCSFCVECACIKNNCAVSRYWKKFKNSLKTPSKDNAVKKRRQSSSDGSRRNSVSSDKDPTSPRIGSPIKGSPGKSPQRKLSTASSPPPKLNSPLKYSYVSTLLAASALLDGQPEVAKSLNFDVTDAFQKSPPPPTSPHPVAPKSATSSRRTSRATVEESVKEEKPVFTPNSGNSTTKEKTGKVKELKQKEKEKEKDNKDHHYHHVEVKRERKNSRRQSQDEVEVSVDTAETTQPASEPEETPTPSDCPRKMTREERKLDAIMKAFEKMEKREERKKEAMARGDHNVKKGPEGKPRKKEDGDGLIAASASQSRSTSQDEQMEVQGDTAIKTEAIESVKASSSPEQGCESANSDADSKVKNEPVPQGITSPPAGITGTSLSPVASTENSVNPEPTGQVKEETKPQLITPSTNPRPVRRTGKRRRRRSRVQSTSVVADTASLSTDEGNSNSSFPPAPLSVPSTPSITPVSTPLPPSTDSTDSTDFNFKFKTKKHLFNEWSNKQYDENKEEMFVQCLPSPHVNNMDHLQRRNSHSSGCSKGTESSVGSAKKRWLRQAMHEVPAPVAFRHSLSVTTELEQTNTSPAPGSASPNPGGQASPRAGSPLDFVTPLKKRRLMRESLSREVNGGSTSPSAGVLAESLASNGVALPRTNGVKQFFPAHRHSTDDRLLLHKNYPHQNGFMETVLTDRRANPASIRPELPSLTSPHLELSNLNSPHPAEDPRTPLSPALSQASPAMMNGLSSPPLPPVVPVTMGQPSINQALKFRNLFEKMEVDSSEAEHKDHRAQSSSLVRPENGIGSFSATARQREILATNYEEESSSGSTVVVVNRSSVYNGVRNFMEGSSEVGCVTAKSIITVDDGPAIVRVDLNAHEMEPSSLSDANTAVVNLRESLFQLNTATSSSSSTSISREAPRLDEVPGECQVNSSGDFQALLPMSRERNGPSVDICDNNVCTDSSVVQVNMEDNSLVETPRLATETGGREAEEEVVDSSQHVNRALVNEQSLNTNGVEEQQERVQVIVAEQASQHCAESSSPVEVLANEGISSSGQGSENGPEDPNQASASVCDSVENGGEVDQPESEAMEVDTEPDDQQSASGNVVEEETTCDSAGTSSTDLVRRSEESQESNEAVSESHQSEQFFHRVVGSDGNVDSTCEQTSCQESSPRHNQGLDGGGTVDTCDSNFERRPVWSLDFGDRVMNIDDSSLEGQGVSSSNVDCSMGDRLDWDSDSCGQGESDNAISSVSGSLSQRISHHGQALVPQGDASRLSSRSPVVDPSGEELERTSLPSPSGATVSVPLVSSAQSNVPCASVSTLAGSLNVSYEVCEQSSSVLNEDVQCGQSSAVSNEDIQCEDSSAVSSESVPCEESSAVLNEDAQCDQSSAVSSESVSNEQSLAVLNEGAHCKQSTALSNESAPFEQGKGVSDESVNCEQSSDVPDEGVQCGQSSCVSDEGVQCEQSRDVPDKSVQCEQSTALSNEGASCEQSSSVSNEGGHHEQSTTVSNERVQCEESSAVYNEGVLCDQSSVMSNEGVQCEQSTITSDDDALCEQGTSVSNDSTPSTSAMASPTDTSRPTSAASPISSSAEAMPAAKKKVSLLEYRKRLKEKPATTASETKTCTSVAASSLSLSPSSSLLMLSPNRSSAHSSYSSTSLSSLRLSPSSTSSSLSSSLSPSRSHKPAPKTGSHSYRKHMPTLATLPLFKSSDPRKEKRTPEKRKYSPRPEKQLSLSERLRLEFGVEDCGDEAAKKMESLGESEVASTNGTVEDAPPPPPPPKTPTYGFKSPSHPSQQGPSTTPVVNGGSGYYHTNQQQTAISSTVGSSRPDRSSAAYSLSANNLSSNFMHRHQQQQIGQLTSSTSPSSSSNVSSHSSVALPGPLSFHKRAQPSSSQPLSSSGSIGLPLGNQYPSSSVPKQFDMNYRTCASGGREDLLSPSSSSSTLHRSGSSSSSLSSSSSTSSSHRHYHHHHSSSGKNKSNKAAASSSSRFTDSRSKY